MEKGTTGELLIAKERRNLDRWAAGDIPAWAEGAAPDVTYFDDIGAQHRINGYDAFREYASSLEGKIPPHTYEIVDPKVQVYGDTGILTFQYHPTQMSGEPGTPWKATSVYRQVDGKWRLVHGHWSMIRS